MVNTVALNKLNNTEAKLTGVPPHCFVIVIVKTAMLPYRFLGSNALYD